MSIVKPGNVFTAKTPLMTVPVTADQTQDYDATSLTLTLAGRVRSLQSSAGILVRAVGVYTDNQGVLHSDDRSIRTASSGSYSLTVPYGWRGTLRPVKAGWAFNPAVRTLAAMTAAQTAQDFGHLRVLPFKMRRR
jgi:hypothetical protein